MIVYVHVYVCCVCGVCNYNVMSCAVLCCLLYVCVTAHELELARVGLFREEPLALDVVWIIPQRAPSEVDGDADCGCSDPLTPNPAAVDAEEDFDWAKDAVSLHCRTLVNRQPARLSIEDPVTWLWRSSDLGDGIQFFDGFAKKCISDDRSGARARMRWNFSSIWHNHTWTRCEEMFLRLKPMDSQRRFRRLVCKIQILVCQRFIHKSVYDVCHWI